MDEPLALCLQDKGNMEGKYSDGMSGILEKMTGGKWEKPAKQKYINQNLLE